MLKSLKSLKSLKMMKMMKMMKCRRHWHPRSPSRSKAHARTPTIRLALVSLFTGVIKLSSSIPNPSPCCFLLGLPNNIPFSGKPFPANLRSPSGVVPNGEREDGLRRFCGETSGE